MRNGYNQQQQHKGTTTFSLPNLCSKPSMINDVHVPAANPSFNKQALHYYSSSDDPSLSPKVGCMGQVKKKNLQQQQQNYKQQGMVFPTTSTTSTNNYNSTASAVGFGHSSSNNFSYSKLLRLFSSKTLLTTPSSKTTKTTTTTATTSCSTRKSHLHQNRLRSRSCEDGAIGGFGSPINVADLDPPLPVIIKKKITSAALVSDGDNNNNNSLWKRRSGGTALNGLQIQLQVHIPIIQPSISI